MYASSMISAIQSRYENMTEDELAAYEDMLDMNFPVYEQEIDGENRQLRALTLNMGDDQEALYYGLYYAADTESWMIVPLNVAE